MKKSSFCVLFCLLQLALMAQEKTRSLSLYVTVLNDGQIVHKKITGDGTNANQSGFLQAGIEGTKRVKKNLDFVTGLQFSRQSFTISYASYPGSVVQYPDDQYKILLLSIPAAVQFHFWNYCFLRGGLLADVQTAKRVTSHSFDAINSISNQSDIGATFGFGVQYFVNKNLAVYTTGTADVHGLILFSAPGYKKQLLESGLRTGLRYRF